MRIDTIPLTSATNWLLVAEWIGMVWVPSDFSHFLFDKLQIYAARAARWFCRLLFKCAGPIHLLVLERRLKIHLSLQVNHSI